MKRLLLVSCLAMAGTAALAQTLTWSVPPRGVAIAADAAENVYTADWEYAPAGDIVLTKTSPNGVTLFTVRRDNTDSTRHEVATWVETDSTGGAYVSGTIRSGFSSPVNANALLMRFAADGRLLWRSVLGSDFDGGSTVKLLRDATDNAYVLGLGPTPAGVRTRIHRVSPDGTATLLWYDPFGIGAPVNLKWGLDGSLVVAARGPTGTFGGAARVALDGRTLSSSTAVPALGTVDAAVDAAGNLYVASVDPTTRQGRLSRLSASFGGSWIVSDPVALARVEIAPDGGVVAAGFPSVYVPGVAFVKFSPTGTLLWANRDADGPANAFLSHGQMRLDARGNGYLAASNLSQMSVTRVNADGSTGWSMLAPFGGGVALAFGAQTQAVYVVGGQTARIDQGGSPPPPQHPDLVATLTDTPDPVRVNTSLTLTTTVRNFGNAAAAGVTLTQSLSSRVQLVSVSTSQGSCTTAPPLQCALGSLAPGASATITRVVRPRSTGTLTTTATAATTTAEPLTSNNTAAAQTMVTRR